MAGRWQNEGSMRCGPAGQKPSTDGREPEPSNIHKAWQQQREERSIDGMYVKIMFYELAHAPS